MTVTSLSFLRKEQHRLSVYEVYTSNGGELLREYLSQVVTLVIIAFLLWRVETLQELKDEA